MADVVIKKKVSLSYLGEEYKDSYITFKALPISEYETFINNSPTQRIEEIKYLTKLLKDKFLDGKFQGQELAKEDIPKFDEGTLARCLRVMTGELIDPKD